MSENGFTTATELLATILSGRKSEWEDFQLAKFTADGIEPPKNWKNKYKEPSEPATDHVVDPPDGWVASSLEQLTSANRVICYGILMPKEHVPDGVPYVKVRDMRGDRIDFDSLPRTAPEIADKYARASLKAGDVLLAIRGTYGRVAEVPPELEGGNITQDSARLSLSSKINHRFVAWHLRSPVTQEYFKRVARGVAVKGVNIGDVRPCPIYLPSLPLQNRILEKIEELLSDLDAGVAALERAKAKLKKYRASVLKAAVEGRLTEQWRADNPDVEPASKLLERILQERRKKWEAEHLRKFEEKGKEPPKNWKAKYKEPAPVDTSTLPALPEAWCWARVDQVGYVQLGRQRSPKNRSKDFPTKYMRAANITEQGLDFSDVLDMEFKPHELVNYRLAAGDILVSEASGSPDQVGKPAVWNEQLPVCCFQNTVIRLRPSPSLGSSFLLTVFRHCYVNHVFARIAGGVGINHLSAAKFANISIPLAPMSEQKVIVDEVDRRLSTITVLERQLDVNLARAARLRQSILKRAFEGKLVSQDSNDEPASKLLGRLRADGLAAQENGKPLRAKRSPGKKRKPGKARKGKA